MKIRIVKHTERKRDASCMGDCWTLEVRENGGERVREQKSADKEK